MAARRLLRESLNAEAKPLVGGRAVDSLQSPSRVINPATNHPVCDVSPAGKAEAEEALASAKASERSLSHDASARQSSLSELARLMLRNEGSLADLLHEESGKTSSEALAEVRYASSFAQQAAGACKQTLAGTGGVPVSPPFHRLSVMKQPVGPVWAVTPNNFPLAMPCRKLAPALAAGCPVLLQPSSQTPLSAIALASLALQSGFGSESVSVLPTGDDPTAVGNFLAHSKDVRALSFTGSTATGKNLALMCIPTMKRLTLELGGNAPFIVHDSADIEHAASAALYAKYRNSGQTCIAPQRFLVARSCVFTFAQRLAAKASELEFDRDVGAIISEEQLAHVERHVADSNASILSGGRRRSNTPGNFYHPTVAIMNGPAESDDMTLAFTEETFGPVAFISAFDDLDEAIERANRTDTGLVAYAFASDLKASRRFETELMFGMRAINTGVVSNASVPFGGIKQSGFGREGGHEATHEYFDTISVFEGELP